MKRTFDICVSLFALALLSLPMVVIALLIRWRLGSPVFFRQKRAGLNGKEFCIIKFRSLTAACGPDGVLLPDAERQVGVGRFLRATSFDELPELWNVLMGDMSLVGPRPLLAEYLPLYSECQSRRHEVRPGVTGWAQINGRNAMSWEDKFILDVWYVDHYSFLLDLKILWITIWKVLVREGVDAEGGGSMPKFQGLKEADHRK